MALFNHPRQGIPIRVRRRSLLAGQIPAPRLQLTGIQGIALAPHLEKDSIDTILLQIIQLTCQNLLHTVTLHTLELTVNTLNPCAPELPLRILGDCRCCYQEQQNKPFVLHIGTKIQKNSIHYLIIHALFI